MGFLEDNCTDANGTLFQNHTPNIGGVWTVFQSGASEPTIENNEISIPTVNQWFYYNTATPPSADYLVKATLRFTSGGGNTHGVVGRYQTGTGQYYAVQIKNIAGVWTVRIFEGVDQRALSAAVSVSFGVPFELKLLVSGDTVYGYFNDTEVVSWTDPTPITLAGKAGVLLQGGVWFMDNILADAEAKSLEITDSYTLVEGLMLDTGDLCSTVMPATKPVYDEFDGTGPLQNHNLDTGEVWVQEDEFTVGEGLANSLVVQDGKLQTKAGSSVLGTYRLDIAPRTRDYDGGFCFTGAGERFQLYHLFRHEGERGWQIGILPGGELRITRLEPGPGGGTVVYDQIIWIIGANNLIEYQCRGTNTKIWLNSNLIVDDDVGSDKAGVIKWHVIGSAPAPEALGAIQVNWFYFDDSFGATDTANNDLVFSDTFKALEGLVLQKLLGDKQVNIFETMGGNEVLSLTTTANLDLLDFGNMRDSIIIEKCSA